MYDIMCKLETDMELLGVTGVEDKLQVNVQQTLEGLRSAGIKVWMLTGDKLETAKNIGFSCQLLTDEMTIYECATQEDADKMFTFEFIEQND